MIRAIFFDHHGDLKEVSDTAQAIALWAWGKDLSRVAFFKKKEGWWCRVDVKSAEVSDIARELETA